jgi:hypothetical protein
MSTPSTAASSTSGAPFGDCPGNYVAGAPTTLRCAKCTRPLLVKDAKRTPTGYVCPYFVKARVATFYNATPLNYLALGVLCLPVGLLAGVVLNLVGGFVYLGLLLGPAAGAGIAELIQRIFKGKRGQYFWLVAALCVGLGAGTLSAGPALFGLLSGSIGGLFRLLPLISIGLMLSALIYRLR